MIGTKINIIDLSEITESKEIVTADNSPVILTCFPSAKGTERMVVVKGTENEKMFGSPDFKKYGQVSIQNQRMIEAGARLVAKRVVATNAKLANTTIIADIALETHVTDEIMVDEKGEPMYETSGGGFESDGITPIPEVKTPIYVVENIARITYDAVSIPDVKTIEDVSNHFSDIGIIPEAADVLNIEDGQVVYDPRNEQYRASGEPADYTEYQGYWIVNESDLEEKTITLSDGKTTKKVNVLSDGAEPVSKHYRFALFTVTDIGRGVSNKTFTVQPENSISKKLNFMYYTFSIIENNTTLESVRCSILPDVNYRGQCVDLNMSAKNNLKYSQINCYEDGVYKFIQTVSDISGIELEDLQCSDFINGTTRKGIEWPGIVVNGITSSAKTNTDGIDLRNAMPTLDYGDNGDFGASPMDNAATKALVERKVLQFYSDDQSDFVYDNRNRLVKYVADEDAAPGKKGYFYLDATDDVYDLDTYQIDAVFDACWSAPIKKAISELGEYRYDFHYFRDHGLECANFDDAAAMVDGTYYNFYDEMTHTGEDHSDCILKSCISSDWVQAYDVINPFDMKQVKVSIMYDLSHDMISHILNNVQKPYAGPRNNAIITSIIKDTLNYKPRITPSINEKDELEEIKCNYASYYKDTFVIESLWTSQEKYTQLSFINNIMAVQKVIKALRVKFPSVRYQVITSAEDINSYTTEINEFLSIYAGMFAELRFEYVADPVLMVQKIYRANLYFRFNDFIQGEMIDAYMLPSTGVY